MGVAHQLNVTVALLVTALIEYIVNRCMLLIENSEIQSFPLKGQPSPSADQFLTL